MATVAQQFWGEILDVRRPVASEDQRRHHRQRLTVVRSRSPRSRSRRESADRRSSR